MNKSERNILLANLFSTEGCLIRILSGEEEKAENEIAIYNKNKNNILINRPSTFIHQNFSIPVIDERFGLFIHPNAAKTFYKQQTYSNFLPQIIEKYHTLKVKPPLIDYMILELNKHDGEGRGKRHLRNLNRLDMLDKFHEIQGRALKEIPDIDTKTHLLNILNKIKTGAHSFEGEDLELRVKNMLNEELFPDYLQRQIMSCFEKYYACCEEKNLNKLVELIDFRKALKSNDWEKLNNTTCYVDKNLPKLGAGADFFRNPTNKPLVNKDFAPRAFINENKVRVEPFSTDKKRNELDFFSLPSEINNFTEDLPFNPLSINHENQNIFNSELNNQNSLEGVNFGGIITEQTTNDFTEAFDGSFKIEKVLKDGSISLENFLHQEPMISISDISKKIFTDTCSKIYGKCGLSELYSYKELSFVFQDLHQTQIEQGLNYFVKPSAYSVDPTESNYRKFSINECLTFPTCSEVLGIHFHPLMTENNWKQAEIISNIMKVNQQELSFFFYDPLNKVEKLNGPYTLEEAKKYSESYKSAKKLEVSDSSATLFSSSPAATQEQSKTTGDIDNTSLPKNSPK